MTSRAPPRRNQPMPDTKVQSIAVIGAGAVGCYYGARLAEAGHDVRFLVRRDYEAVRDGGIHVTSHLGDLHLPAPAIGRSTEQLAERGPVDWLIVALKSLDLDQLASLAAPLLSAETNILAIINGIGIEDEIAQRMRRYGIFGGLGYIGVGRPRPGQIVHREFGALDIGHHGDDPRAVAAAVALWEPSVVAARPVDCLVRARWHKMLWDVPFNGLSVIAGGANSEFILETPAVSDFARRVMAEIASLAEADLAARKLPPIADIQAACERAMRLMRTTEKYIPHAGVDFVRQRPMEVEAMFDRPLQRAAELGVELPLTAFLTALMGRLNPASVL